MQPAVLYTRRRLTCKSDRLSSLGPFWQGLGAEVRGKAKESMNDRKDSMTERQTAEMTDTGNEATRSDESGDVAEPDAPTDVKENVGMSTILDGGAGSGVQSDAGDE